MVRQVRATTTTEQKIQHALTEARVVLPGAQALLGFQFVAVLLGGFATLPMSSRYVHVASLTLVTLSTILLMTPAAYHRIVERGEATEHFFRLASATVLWSLIPLGLGTCADFFILARQISGSLILASAATVAILICFMACGLGSLSISEKPAMRRNHLELRDYGWPMFCDNYSAASDPFRRMGERS
jgi:hypothetical protein